MVLSKVWVLAAIVIALSGGSIASDEAAQFNERLQRGVSELNSGSYREAISDFKAANKLQHGECGGCYLGIAAAQLHMRDFNGSIENCRKTISISSNAHNKAEAYKIWGDVLMHSIATEPKKLGEAIQQYKSSVELDPNYPPAHLSLGVALLKSSRDDEGTKELQRFLESSPTGSDADLARKLIAKPDRARLNYAPDFEGTTASGQTISLSQFVGKVVVLDFWATWCPSCIQSLPEMKELVKKYGPTGELVVISISDDANEQQWRTFISRKKMDWLQIRDSDHSLGKTFTVYSIPTYLIVDRAGVIRQRIVGRNPQETLVGRLKSELGQMLE